MKLLCGIITFCSVVLCVLTVLTQLKQPIITVAAEVLIVSSITLLLVIPIMLSLIHSECRRTADFLKPESSAIK
jgi:hypothetical protein